jgi:hypothetical protein
MNFWYKPAFYAHVISSIAMIIALALIIVNYKKLLQLNAVELIKIFTLLAIAIAAHGKGHLDLEKEYGYNPVRYLLG